MTFLSHTLATTLDALGSPPAMIGFGATTLILVGTTYFYYNYFYLASLPSLSKSSKSSKSNGRNSSEVGMGWRRRSSGNGVGVGEKNGVGNGMAKAPELDRTKYPGGHLTIYYGSQTGTAEMFAKQIASEGESHGFLVRVVDLQDVIENEEWEGMKLMEGTYGEDGLNGLDEDAALIRATLTHPHYRDPANDGNDRDASTKPISKALFFMATYGEGEPTDNATQFIEMMKGKSGIANIYKLGKLDSSNENDEEAKDDLDATDETDAPSPTLRHPTFLSDLHYAVFGLGNKQYEHYNNMGKFTDAALSKCGATRICSMGLGDDDDDLEGDFENWKDGVLWPGLKKGYVQGDLAVDDETKEGKETNESKELKLPPCCYRVEYMENMKKIDIPHDMIHTSSKHYFTAVECPIVAKRELRSDADPGSTIHMEIDIAQHLARGTGNTMKYQTADNLGVLPENPREIVEAVASALNYDLDQIFHVLPATPDPSNASEPTSAKHTLPFPTPLTIRSLLTHYCDLLGSPRRSDLKQLSHYCTNQLDRAALLRMSSKEGKQEYRSKIVERKIGFAEIVTQMCQPGSVTMPLEHWIMVCPRLMPRYYTISSSSEVWRERIHLTFSVLEEEVAGMEGMEGMGGVEGRSDNFKGLCSNYLAGKEVGDVVRVFVRDSTFRLPKETEHPILMIGPGTGIAPMRAILQERSHSRTQHPTATHGPNILYFGCKSRTLDYLYQSELEHFQKEGTLTQLHLAFSREQADKVYVQHLLAKNARETYKLIHEENACIFVCGGVKMGHDVDGTLQDILVKEGGMERAKAKSYLEGMARKGRFVQELWS